MAEDFDLFESDLFAASQPTQTPIPEAQDESVTPSEPEPKTEAPVGSERPARRRRRRPRRPKWQQLLWKYWPPVRFGLIILAGVLIIWLLISAVGSMFSTGETQPSEPDVPPAASSTDTIPSEDTTPTETEEPTEDTTPTETTPPDPYAGAVDESWYENTLFIGDFGINGLKTKNRFDGADYFCSSGMGVFNYDEQKVSDTNFDEQDIASLLASKTYDKIIINLGINNCGYSTSSLIKAYGNMVDTIRQAQPNAKIILQGIMAVTKEYAGRADYFSASHISGVNQRIMELADGIDVYYVDLNPYFTDSDGYLNPAITTDGCHLKSSGYADWAKVLSVEIGRLGIE